MASRSGRSERSPDGLHGGEAADQGVPRGGGDAQGRLRLGLLIRGDTARAVEVGVEVHVGVDETRHDRVGPQVEDRALRGGLEGGDPPALDADARAAQDVAATVECAVGEEDGGAGGRRRRGLGAKGDGGGEEECGRVGHGECQGSPTGRARL